MNQKRIEKLVLSAMFCALVFAATWISVPAPGVGNVNLGDAMILLCAWMLGGPYAVVAGALGAALTDLMGAYAIYAPATLLIKALMVLVAILVAKGLRSIRVPTFPSLLVSGICAELVMIVGYYLYEAFFLSLGAVGALLSVPFNAVQGALGLILALLCRMLLRHTSFHFGKDEKDGKK
jgi:uncharacterized membrane protein